MLKKLKQINLYLNINKYEFYIKYLKYLKFIIIIKKFKMNSTKIEIIIN